MKGRQGLRPRLLAARSPMRERKKTLVDHIVNGLVREWSHPGAPGRRFVVLGVAAIFRAAISQHAAEPHLLAW